MKAKQVRLYQGDCLDKLSQVEDGSVDMILTDLPYGTTANKWDSVIELEPMWAHFRRVTKENAAIVLFAQKPFDVVLGASNLKELKYEWIWEKEMGSNFLQSKGAPLKTHENILVFYRKPPPFFQQGTLGKAYTLKQGNTGTNYGSMRGAVVTENKGRRCPKTILHFKRDPSRVHPTQKPVALLRYLIRTYTERGHVVLDATMGSGSTGVAAVHEKRRFIGIERDANYFRIARQRILDKVALVRGDVPGYPKDSEGESL